MSQTNIVLTGAGFTKNFNGFLGREMWSKIFNHPTISHYNRIKSLLSQDYNFESVYSKIVHGIAGHNHFRTEKVANPFTKEEVHAIQSVVEQIYKQMDDSIRDWVMNDGNPTSLDTYKLNELFVEILRPHDGNSFFFTLNQDLLMERQRHYCSPGAPRFSSEFTNFSGKEFLPEYSVTLAENDIPNIVQKEISQNSNSIHYIKLHGSYGWRSSRGGNQMVIGMNKEEDINNEPLLKSYFEIFQNTLKEGGKKMLIIGYGFRDEHINKIIFDAAKNHGLRLHIITPTPPDKFEAGNFVYDSYRLWEAVDGYYPYSLREIFPPNQSGSVHLEEIKKGLLLK